MFLIASNAAAVLPAFWSLRNKAFAEWVLFMSSGTASALYHACDVGTWCIMPFHVLQVLFILLLIHDFYALSSWTSGSLSWPLSVLLCIYPLLVKLQRGQSTIVAILTAIMAENDPTRARNIAFVIGLGALGLLVGWLLEFLSHARSFSFSTELHLNLLNRWESVKGWTRNIIKTTIKRFHWGFLPAGLITLAMAAISWALESTETYWIWHSLWHIFIYTSSFFFLCSKAKVANCDNERTPDEGYELTRQTSFNRGYNILDLSSKYQGRFYRLEFCPLMNLGSIYRRYK
ncbi:UNVERIFIED_CONTAM: hypothetical protein Sangu_0013800 [Sesamum angustifolium]|uniref:Uncharacterized protein n=1 Tax=Sesamum angustifolium TaxID=2727405 RepID=A0AAW2RHN9_9LAMI